VQQVVERASNEVVRATERQEELGEGVEALRRDLDSLSKRMEGLEVDCKDIKGLLRQFVLQGGDELNERSQSIPVVRVDDLEEEEGGLFQVEIVGPGNKGMPQRI
jgi:predicted  nucleic acid-binding Zn-ribbon protein